MGKYLNRRFTKDDKWVTNKLIKRFSILLVILEMKIKTTMLHFVKQFSSFFKK